MLKFQWNKKYTTIALYACAVIAIAIVALALILNLRMIGGLLARFFEILLPIVYGLIIAYICNPILKFWERTVFRRKKSKRLTPQVIRYICTPLTFLVVGGIFSLFLFLVVPEIVTNWTELKTGFFDNVNNILRIVGDFAARFGIDFPITNISNAIESILREEALIRDMIDKIRALSGAFLLGFVRLVLGFILAFFFLLWKEHLIASAKKVFAAFLPKKMLIHLVDTVAFANRTFGRYFIGVIFDSLCLGIIIFFTLMILRFPYYPLVSVIVCLTNIIPYLGPFIGAVPSFIIIFLESPIHALWFVLIILIAQQIDGNIIAPRIIGNAVGLPGIWVIISVTVMGGLFGPVGMLIGVPVFTVLIELSRRSINKRLTKQGLPTTPELYDMTFTETFHFAAEIRAYKNGEKQVTDNENESRTLKEGGDGREDQPE